MTKDEKEKKPFEATKGYGPKEIEKRIVKNFLDILILIEMKKKSSLSGYDVITFVNKTFGGMISAGTVYSTMYLIERKGLVKGIPEGRKTIYSLTEKGEATVDYMMSDFNEQMAMFARKFLTL